MISGLYRTVSPSKAWEFLAKTTEVHSLGEILAYETVCVLTKPPFPRSGKDGRSTSPHEAHWRSLRITSTLLFFLSQGGYRLPSPLCASAYPPLRGADRYRFGSLSALCVKESRSVFCAFPGSDYSMNQVLGAGLFRADLAEVNAWVFKGVPALFSPASPFPLP